MARTALCNAGTNEARGTAYGIIGSAPTVAGSPLRPGALIPYVFQCSNSAGSATQHGLYVANRAAGGIFDSLFRSVRFYFRMSAIPTQNNLIMAQTSGSSTTSTFDRLLLNSSGNLIIQDSAGANGVTSSLALSIDTWYLMEFDVGWSSGNGRRIYVDGVEWASSSATAASTLRTGYKFGNNINALSQGACDFFFCDLMFDDDTFATSGFPGHGMQVLLLPTADSNRGTWTGGAGGTSDIYVGIDNVPPTGDGTPADADQISNANGSANQDYVATMQSYTTAGVPSGARLHLVQAFVVHGEQVSTATKAGSVWIASNPTQGAATSTFDFGQDAGAEGTYPTNWGRNLGAPAAAPSVTFGTAPTCTVRKTGSTTRVVDVCFLAIIVDFWPSPEIRRFSQTKYNRPVEIGRNLGGNFPQGSGGLIA